MLITTLSRVPLKPNNTMVTILSIPYIMFNLFFVNKSSRSLVYSSFEIVFDFDIGNKCQSFYLFMKFTIMKT
jgi:hypothetical protein